MRLFSLLFPIIGTTLAGIGVVVALVMGYNSWLPILIAAAIGTLISLPVAWFIGQKVGSL